MNSIVVASGSPKDKSRSALLGQRVQLLLAEHSLSAVQCNVRELPAEDLLWGQSEAPAIHNVLSARVHARGVVGCSPIYKAAYTGVLKLFLDLLPQSGLAVEFVLPLVTGKTMSHMLAIDYALRPVLNALSASHVVSGLFVLDTQLGRLESGEMIIEDGAAQRLKSVVDEFARIVIAAGQSDGRGIFAGAGNA